MFAVLLGLDIFTYQRGSMYCPRCGQQQISDEMKFCSRCGLPMSGLGEWLAERGTPALREQDTQVATVSPRKIGIRRGAKVMFASGVLFPVFLVLSLIIDEGAPMIVPIVVFFVSLVMMLYARLFGEVTSPVRSQSQTTTLLSGASQNPGHQQVRTNELLQPPSVTDHTTKLLDE
jgi:endogenous inhibitor of DNA gyrase (YacG/DUF329 family)